MAVTRFPSAWKLQCRSVSAFKRPVCPCKQRKGRAYSQAAAVAEEDYGDLEQDSSMATEGPSEELTKTFDPVKQSASRNGRLPPGRFQYRPPRYYRGPLHPIQPPKTSDPSSRAFVPGPFSTTRVEQTSDAVIEPDLMTLRYNHVPGGHPPPLRTDRLREWDGSSPYHKNRPLRAARGTGGLRLQTRPTTFRNIPRLEKIVLHTLPENATVDSAYLHAGGMALQAITGLRATAVKAKQNVGVWNLKKGSFVALKVELTGEDMYHFLAKCIDSVLPRIKDWKGVAGTSGDESGNISFGLTSEGVGLFPEIEVNYDM
ncbi:MAG: hypothetical protein M1814_003209 [Vezdaea aestivalis]|nr:MAG: hypothetical protein M1814_003209 [Vezdaea aestivalis]